MKDDSWFKRLLSTSCLKPSSSSPYDRMKNKDDDHDAGHGGEDDTLLWSKDLDNNSHGEFSFAVVQGNKVLEDQSQVETGSHATFIGVYDGHGGTDASKYICNHLFPTFLKLARENGTLSEDILRTAFSETEKGFLTLVRRAFVIKPEIAGIGSCCLVGVFWKRILYVANVGDSRAVIGCLDKSNKVVPEQLTRDHSASMEDVRQELRTSHPNDPEILVQKQGVWSVKGIIQVSRSIGDAYLKRPEFSLDSSSSRFHLHVPVLRSDPTIVTRELQPMDKFVIFASDGLWEYLTNEEAVEIVHNNPREGIARRLVVCAMEKAARISGKPYNDMKKLGDGARRQFHDDISVVVTFIDHEKLDNITTFAPSVSVRGFVDEVRPSDLNFFNDDLCE